MQLMGARFLVSCRFQLFFTTPDLPISYAIQMHTNLTVYSIQYLVHRSHTPAKPRSSPCIVHVKLQSRTRVETSSFQNLKASLQAREPHRRSRFRPGRSLRIFTGPPDFCLSPWAKEPGVNGRQALGSLGEPKYWGLVKLSRRLLVATGRIEPALRSYVHLDR